MIRTNYINVVKELIHSLERLVAKDLGDPDTRHAIASAMYRAYYQISDPQERELAYKIMNDGGDLESETVLEIDHPMYDQDLVDYKNSVGKIISYLKEIQPL